MGAVAQAAATAVASGQAQVNASMAHVCRTSCNASVCKAAKLVIVIATGSVLTAYCIPGNLHAQHPDGALLAELVQF